MFAISLRCTAAVMFVLAGYMLALNDWGLAVAGIANGTLAMWLLDKTALTPKAA